MLDSIVACWLREIHLKEKRWGILQPTKRHDFDMLSPTKLVKSGEATINDMTPQVVVPAHFLAAFEVHWLEPLS